MDVYSILKKSIETKFGENIINSGVASSLVNSILTETDESISVNTIRRLFGLIKSNQKKISPRILNILSRYCGFRSYREMLDYNSSSVSWRLINDIGFVSSLNLSDFTKLVNRLSDYISVDIRALLTLGMLTNELLHKKDELKLLKLFDIKIDNLYEKNHLKELTNCCNIFANTLRDYEFLNSENLIRLANKETFVRIYLHHFIDYGLNKNFLNLVKNTSDTMFNQTDYAFKYLFIDRHQFLTESTYEIENNGLSIQYDSLSNNFVKGRWIASMYLRDEKINFGNYFKNGPYSILLAKEILVFALIKNDFEKINQVCENYSCKDFWKIDWHIINEKLILEMFLVLNEFKQTGSCSRDLENIDIHGHSDNQCLDYNKTIYFYIKGILNGFNSDIKKQFNQAKKRTYLNSLKIENYFA